MSKKAQQGAKKEIKAVSKIFDFCKNDYNLAGNTHFWAWSKFNSFANIDPLMANGGALKMWDQGGIVLGLLAGGRHNYESKLLVQDKQIVESQE